MNINPSTRIERIKNFAWVNKTNNNSSFSLTLPIDNKLPVTPVLGGFIRVSPGDTIMQIEKREKLCDDSGNHWWLISGRTHQGTDDQVRAAQNNGTYFRYIYNGVNNVTFSSRGKGVIVATIQSRDILNSSFYEDNLGGFTETVLVEAGREAFSWSSTVVSQPKPQVTTVQISVNVTSSYGSAESVGGGVTMVIQRERQDVLTANSHSVFVTDETISTTSGTNSGSNGRSDIKRSSYQWITNDVSTDVTVEGPNYQTFLYYQQPSLTPVNETRRARAVIRTRTVTMRTDSQMLALMQGERTPGSVSGIAPVHRTTYVIGGHEGYKCIIKSKGDVGTRYKVDYNLGDTVTVNDTRLGIIYTAVVSGAVETIDSNGYSVDIELGTLGATVEQRLNRTI